MKLSFLGAAREVTGSNYLLETNNKKILVDCGIFQGRKFTEEKNYQPFNFNPSEIDYLFLTHAHLDHCGRIPKLYKEGFRGKIFCTKPTQDFASVMLEDSQHVLAMEAKRGKYPVLYEKKDVEKVIPLFHGVDYHKSIKLDESISYRWQDAGHVLGSGILELWVDGKKIVFSGDLGNPPVPILRITDSVKEADYLVIESTYGDREHEDAKERLLMLSSAIYEITSMKGVLMIPAFALERTQEVLYELNKLIESKEVPQVPVFVDSPLAIKATRVFRKHEKLFDKEARGLIDSGDDVFNFPGLKMTEKKMESKKINEVKPPKVIIAGSGMCVGGRIGFHLERYLSDFRSQVLIIGYQVHGSLGRKLVEGEKQVKLHGHPIDVKAKIRAIGAYSAHADRKKLMHWVSDFQKKPKKVFITHGEEDQALAFADALKDKFSLNCTVPKEGDSVEL